MNPWLQNRTVAQWAYFLVGIGATIIVVFASGANFKRLYDADASFFLGGFLMIAGWCIARFFSSTDQQITEKKAIALIVHGGNVNVEKMIAEKIESQMHTSGGARAISLCRQNIESCRDRLSEFVAGQAGIVDCPLDSPKKIASLDVMDDVLDQALANISNVEASVFSTDNSPASLDHEIRQMLVVLRRDVYEALNRRNDLADTLVRIMPDRISADDHLRSLIVIMTSDLIKARQALRSVLSHDNRIPMSLLLTDVSTYLEAGENRLYVLQDLIRDDEDILPAACAILAKDFADARTILEKIFEQTHSGDIQQRASLELSN